MDLSVIQQYIDQHQLLLHADRVVVGVSGGADSVALLDILYTLGYECIVAHCNFHLRDEESNRDAKHVEALCKSYNLKFNNIDFDTQAYAKDKSISIEMAARELRYSWFGKLRVENHASAIAVAHHADDSAETVLLNLIRGTGIRGLTGIKPRNGNIVRPLLGISRDQVTDYLKSKSIQYVDDRTNNEDIYTRNKIRLNILPMMETINPSVKNSINRTALYLSGVQTIYQNYIDSAKRDILSDDKIDIQKLLRYNEPQTILFEILSEYNFSSATIDDIFSTLGGESGKLFYSDTHRVLKDRVFLIISENSDCKEDSVEYLIEEGSTTLLHPIELFIKEIENKKDFEIEKNKYILYLDKDEVSFPLMLRKWKQGDTFVPFGMKGRKKVSDLFTDLKLSIFDKENAWVLCSSDGNILWVVGLRSDDRYKVTNDTKHILKVIYHQ